MKIEDTYFKNYKSLIEKYVSLSITDIEGNIVYVSEAFCKMTRYTEDELLGKNHSILRHPEMPSDLYDELWRTITQGKSWHGRIKNLNKENEPYWVDAFIEPLFEAQEIIGYLAIRQNITQESIFEKLSKTDLLTGLYNRSATEELILNLIKTAKKSENTFSLIMFDLDNFKEVNDIYGHLKGDFVLKEFAHLAKITVRIGDFIGRWGGEEFLVILPDTKIEQAKELATRLRIVFKNHIFERIGHKTASFGTAEFTTSDTLYTLIEKADQALYLSKSLGKNRVS